MPFLRRPVGPRRNPPVKPPPFLPIAPTLLPTSLILAPPRTKLPPRPVRGDHPRGTFLTVPTVGPLPPVVVTGPTLGPPPIARRRSPFSPVPNTGLPIGRPLRAPPRRRF